LKNAPQGESGSQGQRPCEAKGKTDFKNAYLGVYDCTVEQMKLNHQLIIYLRFIAQTIEDKTFGLKVRMLFVSTT
jgi:hypothetical protein